MIDTKQLRDALLRKATMYQRPPGQGQNETEILLRDAAYSLLEAEAEQDALQRRFAELNELFLLMRDRVAGYNEAPPAARLFDQGANAFEWAATSVRRAAAGEPPLDPPVPLRRIGDDGLTVDGELAREGWRRHILTCDTCGTRFLCSAIVRVEHEPDDNPAVARHYGRIIREEVPA